MASAASRTFYYASILVHFFGDRGKKYSALSSELMSVLENYSANADRNILSFLVSVRELLDTGMNLNATDIEMCARNSIEALQNSSLGAIKTENLDQVWLVRSVHDQPSKETLLLQLDALRQVCQTTLIPPLVQMVHSYCSGNVEYFEVGMPVELLDTQLINGPWRMAVLERIERLTVNGEVFFFLKYVGWAMEYSEWIAAQSYRIKLLHDKQGNIVRKCEFYSFPNLVLQQPVDYYLAFSNIFNGRGLWKKGLVSKIEVSNGYNEPLVALMGNQQVEWSRCITTQGTFT